jgi:hypothetical protein
MPKGVVVTEERATAAGGTLAARPVCSRVIRLRPSLVRGYEPSAIRTAATVLVTAAAGVLLVPQTEVRDQLTIALEVIPPEILQQTPAPPHHLQEAAAAVVILLVLVEVAPELVDALREERDLHRCAATIRLVELVLLDDVFLGDGHARRASSRVVRCKGSERGA